MRMLSLENPYNGSLRCNRVLKVFIYIHKPQRISAPLWIILRNFPMDGAYYKPFDLGKAAVALGMFLFLVAGFCRPTEAEKFNSSYVGRIPWVTAVDGEDLERERQMNEQKLTLVDETDTPFASLDSMLRWAIGHSDPEKLRGAAQEVQSLPTKDLENRQAEIKELMEKLRMPSDAELMKMAIDDLNNSSLSIEDHYKALHELLVLVEPIDNANDLNKLGGLTAVVGELYREEEELRIAAAWVLGKASQNNPVVQKQILELGVLPKLMRMAKSSCSDEAVKALYAISAAIRNNPDGQSMFFMEGGALMLQDIMSNSSSDIRLRRKSVFLVADIADSQLDIGGPALSFHADKEYLKSVVNLLAVPDLDIQEKTLMAVRSLLQLDNTYAQAFRDVCHLELALDGLRHQLEDMMLDEQRADFVRDLEALRHEVEFIFYERMKARNQAPDSQS